MAIKNYPQLLSELKAVTEKKRRRELALDVLPELVREAVSSELSVPAECCRWGVLNPDGQFADHEKRVTAEGIAFDIKVDFVEPGTTRLLAEFTVPLSARFTGTDYFIKTGDWDIQVQHDADDQKAKDFAEVAARVGEYLSRRIEMSK